MQSSICLGEALSTSPFPGALACSSKEIAQLGLLQSLLHKGWTWCFHIFRWEQLLFLSSVLSIMGMFSIYQLDIFHRHNLSEWVAQWDIPCGFRQSQDNVLSCWDSGICESPLKKHHLFLYCVLLPKGQEMKQKLCSSPRFRNAN